MIGFPEQRSALGLPRTKCSMVEGIQTELDIYGRSLVLFICQTVPMTYKHS